MGKVEEQTTELFAKSKWIWAGDGTKSDSNVIMRRTFSFGTERPPARAVCRAACDSHYYLFVNGNAAVWHGGLNRGKSTYYDEFDIAKYLIKGDNVIVAYCRYYGNSGRDVVSSGRAGFIFECNDLDIYSDETFSVYENAAYRTPRADNCFYSGHGIDYDASLEGQIQNLLDPAFNSSLFMPATVFDAPDPVMGTLVPRPLPLERFSAQPVMGKYKKTQDKFGDDRYVITLPHTMKLTPYMEVTGNGQEKITVYTDRTDCAGSFGDDGSVYSAHKIEYVTKPTVNIFEGLLPMTGSKLIFDMPRTVKVLKLGYRELGYDTEPTCELSTDNEEVDGLFDKACRTLYCCLDSTIMDTPERERTMWLGDGSIAARAIYLAYNDAAPLVKKVIDDILENADGDLLYSCVPGGVPVDIPAHGLLALSEFGIFAQYRNFVGDLTLLRTSYARLCDYLMLWAMTPHGVEPRDGSRRWYDNLYNVDEILVENALYFSACKFCKETGAAIGNNDYEEYLSDRMDNIAEFIESRWDGLGYTSKDGVYDDRANALVVLCGLVPDDRKSDLARLLAATVTASPYLEWAVVEALAALGRSDLAFERFVSRNTLDARSDRDTLGEDYSGYGSKCQSYRSAVISELVSVFGGIDVKNGAGKITITPDFRALEEFRCALTLSSGDIEVRYRQNESKTEITVENRTSADVTLEIIPECMKRATERRTINVNKGKNKFSI